MLSMKAYPDRYVAACEARFERHVDTISELGPEGVAVLAPDAVLLLEHLFVHRMRGNEGKDGNPLNEVRLLAESILGNDGVLEVTGGIKLRPEASVSGLAAGEPIVLDEARLRALGTAYFAEIRTRFGE